MSLVISIATGPVTISVTVAVGRTTIVRKDLKSVKVVWEKHELDV